MKAAKIILSCLLTILVFSLIFTAQRPRIISAAAQSYRYARADARDIYFCERKDLAYALFTIPYTYCVEIISSDGEWYYVKYAEETAMYCSLYGYCKAEHLTPVEQPPENIYLNKTVPLTFKTDTPVGSLPVDNELTVTAAFYGTFYSGGSAYSYVRYDGKFYYINGANDDYPLNEIPVEQPEDPIKEESGSSSKIIIALVLTALAAAALVILYLTGRKSKYFRPDR